MGEGRKKRLLVSSHLVSSREVGIAVGQKGRILGILLE